MSKKYSISDQTQKESFRFALLLMIGGALGALTAIGVIFSKTNIDTKIEVGQIAPALLFLAASVIASCAGLYIFVNRRLIAANNCYKQTNIKLRREAWFERTTGFLHRPHFVRQLESVMYDEENIGVQYALFVARMDRGTNLYYGKGAQSAERLLKDVAQRLQAVFHGKDAVAPVLGKHAPYVFAVLKQVEDDNEAHHLAKRAHNCITRPYHLNDETVTPKFMIGYSTGLCGRKSGAKLFDEALLSISKDNRDYARPVAFRRAMGEAEQRRSTIELAIAQAMEREEIYPAFQPQVDMRTGQILGYEALARWNSPKFGNISPTEFITIAEEAGQMYELGDYIFNAAISRAAEWEYPFTLAVNVSGVRLKDPALLAKLMTVLERYKFPKERLEIEITESVFADLDDTVVRRLENIRDVGIGIALDDFGTGYSSLSYLSKIPLTKLKIDQSFVRSMVDDPKNRIIASSIIDLSAKLGSKVIAEGVETMQHAQMLSKMGCFMGQGYLFGRPERDMLLGDRVSTFTGAQEQIEEAFKHRQAVYVEKDQNVEPVAPKVAVAGRRGSN